MSYINKLNPFPKSNPDTGFGVQATQMGGRFINKDGTFNLRKEGWSYWRRTSIYSHLLELPFFLFLGVIFLFLLLLNLFFTTLYLLAGTGQLQGLLASTTWGKIRELFYFSVQTFTTVGYGRINPIKDGAHLISSIESMTGLLTFAIVTGLLYGRFTRPKAYIAFSESALISPYKNGIALMFRMVPYKDHHHLTDARVVVTIALTVMEEQIEEFKFYQLNLERSRIDTFNMNWTVVHPIDEESPLLHFMAEDLQRSDVEIYVQVTGFDPVFSTTVLRRTSYTYQEIIWGAKFKPMYHESEDGSTTILRLDRLHDYDKVNMDPEQ